MTVESTVLKYTLIASSVCHVLLTLTLELGSETVTWLLNTLQSHISTREEARQIGQQLMDAGYIDHVSGDATFLDESTAFYRFSKDVESKLPIAPLNQATSQRVLQFTTIFLILPQHFEIQPEILTNLPLTGRPITSEDILKSLAEMEMNAEYESSSPSASSDEDIFIKRFPFQDHSNFPP